MTNYEYHWCPRCETKTRVWMDDPELTGWVECWKCGNTFNLERTGGVERLRDSILAAYGLMDGSQTENTASPTDTEEM